MHRIFGAFLLLGVTMTLALEAHGQTPTQLWVNRFDEPPGAAANYAQGRAVAIDNAGNVFVTGDYGNTSFYCATVGYSPGGVSLWTNIYFPTMFAFNAAAQPAAIAVDGAGHVFVTGSSCLGSLTSAHDNPRFVTLAYSSAGGAPLWTNLYNGSGTAGSGANALALDVNGNVFVTGYASNYPSGLDLATVAYSGTGRALWTNRYNGPGNGNDSGQAIKVDGLGRVFVTGYSVGIGSTNDFVTIAYSNSGLPLWTNRYDGPGSGEDRPVAMALDNNGRVFVCGYSVGPGSYYDYCTIAYSGQGQPLWTNRYNGPGNSNDYPRAIAVGSSGSIYVTGDSYGGATGGYDFATVAYSGTGQGLWTNRYSASGTSSDHAVAIAVDPSGNVIVSGYSGANANLYDYVTVAYSAAGALLWVKRYNGPANFTDISTAICLDAAGNVLVTGYSSNTAGGSYWNEYATIKYSSSVQAYLGIQTMDADVMLSWTNAGFILQSGPTLEGPFQDVPGATTPYIASAAATQQYFRLRAN